MGVSACTLDHMGVRVCPTFFDITYKGTKASMEITASGIQTKNGFSPKIYMRQISKEFYAVDLQGGDARLIISRDGTVHLKMKTNVFKSKVVGLCGNMDNNKDNDFTSFSNSYMDGPTFLGIYSDCREASYAELSCGPVHPTCAQMSSAPMPANTRLDVDSYVKMCTNAQDDQARCSILQSFSLVTYNNFQDIFADVASCDDMTCQRKQIDLCSTNCKDHLYQNCESEIIYDCGCEPGKHLSQNGTCVTPDRCGCYDFTQPDLYLENGEESVNGCKDCVCEGNKLRCEDKCEEVICLHSQVSKQQLLESAGDLSCAREMCPKPFYASLECINVETSSNLCFCGEGMKQTQTGECVEKCPCYEAGKWYSDGEVFTVNCQTKICTDGVFVFQSERPASCTGVCILTGSSMKLKPFDTTTLSESSIEGMCEYTAMEIAGDFSVSFKPIACGQADTACLHIVSIKTPYYPDPILLKSTNPGTVLMGGTEYINTVGPNIQIIDTNYYLSLLVDDLFSVHWNEGLTVRIEVSSQLFGRTQGLCGNFNMDSSDDKTGRDGLQKESLNKLAKSWIVNPETCTMPDDSAISTSGCQNPEREAWARKSCNVILDGESFAECRKFGQEQGYFDNCVAQACNCDTGGDCECLCDSIAAFAAFCNEAGSPARWRHQRLCPMQCDYGSVYKPCGSGCPAACGAHNTSANSLCSSMTCLEGCFCPPGTVRSNILNMAESMCVPVSECPCTDMRGNTVMPGQMLTVDCQTCECTNGKLSCIGERCKTECHEDDYVCKDGRCINAKHKCNGVPDCSDGGDEFDCKGEICNGFSCNNGQCVGNDTVCDNRMDCLDNSDEEMCDVQCEDGEYKCPQSTFCIPASFVCDGVPDCWYGEEELGCKLCPTEQVHCNLTYCIPKEYRCDGHDDCGDGSDETGCTSPTTLAPTECEYETKTFSSPDQDIFLMADSDKAEKVFTTEGWSPSNTGDKANLTVSVISEVTPTLNTVSFDLVGGTGSTVSLIVETAVGKTYVEEMLVTKDPKPYSGTFDTEFDKLTIITSATITNLEVTVCYEPSQYTCIDGLKDLSVSDFGPSSGVDQYDAGNMTEINVDLRVHENVEDNSTDIVAVSFFAVGIANYTATLYYYDEVTPLFEELETPTEQVVYVPPKTAGVERIVFSFVVEEDSHDTVDARVEYLGSKGCFKEYICTKGYCGDVCMDLYDDPCDSECAPAHCTPAPTTPCAVRVVPELDSSFVPPTFGDDDSPLLLEVSSGEYVSDIEVTNVTEDKHPALLKPSDEKEHLIGDGDTKAVVYDKITNNADLYEYESGDGLNYTVVVFVTDFNITYGSDLPEGYRVYNVVPLTEEELPPAFDGPKLLLTPPGSAVVSTKCAGTDYRMQKLFSLKIN
ncbi:hypothetical protein EGW08_004747 [Elysia chlorotica]|uniref:VWFD domain-containing protein n=1 Tax=Elysia chlorotica TaxID=188477 RepID=A0A3S0ZW46_ELYCH|nr:hypothetical protein EGW08_004747 [Elysia chlorotica]